jgi:Metallo-beta-lactamase superfamily
MKISRSIATTAVACTLIACSPAARAADSGLPVDQAKYTNRAVLPDFTEPDCPYNPRALTQVNGNLYRHTTGAGLAVHSGLVLITKEGALVIDPAMTCTAGWLRDEIRQRFNVAIKYVVYTHAHTDHISGAQVLQKDGAIVVANMRRLSRSLARSCPRPSPTVCSTRI